MLQLSHGGSHRFVSYSAHHLFSRIRTLPAVLPAVQSQHCDFTACFSHVSRHSIAVDVHRCTDVRAPHETLLHTDSSKRTGIRTDTPAQLRHLHRTSAKTFQSCSSCLLLRSARVLCGRCATAGGWRDWKLSPKMAVRDFERLVCLRQLLNLQSVPLAAASRTIARFASLKLRAPQG